MLNGSLVDWLQSLHEKYGEIVRIHPTELSFVGPEALHDIFLSRPPLPRPLVGLLAPPTDADDMGATMNTEDHQRMRRVFHNSFSERALKQQEPFVQEHTDILIKRLQDLAEDAEKGSKEVDILEWYSFTSFDVIGDLLFGESFHALENSEQHPWVKTLFTYIKFGVRLTALNNLGPMQQVMRWCTPNSLAEKVATHKEFTRDRVDKRIAQGELRPDLMSEILQSRDQIGLSLGELYSNAALIVIAGAQTSALACGSVTWFLLKNPSAMKRLQKEIRGTFRSVKDITIASTAKLPYLRAVIQETLRLHPPSPLNMSREVDRPGVIVSGHEMPIGVSCTYNNHFYSSYHLHPERTNYLFFCIKRPAFAFHRKLSTVSLKILSNHFPISQSAGSRTATRNSMPIARVFTSLFKLGLIAAWEEGEFFFFGGGWKCFLLAPFPVII